MNIIYLPPPPAHVLVLASKKPDRGHRGSGRRPGSQTGQGAESKAVNLLDENEKEDGNSLLRQLNHGFMIAPLRDGLDFIAAQAEGGMTAFIPESQLLHWRYHQRLERFPDNLISGDISGQPARPQDMFCNIFPGQEYGLTPERFYIMCTRWPMNRN